MDDNYQKIGKQIGFSYFITMLQMMFAPLIVALLTRTLGPGRYGAYVLFSAFIALGSLIFQLGISQYLITKLQSFEKKTWPSLFFSLLSAEFAVLLVFSAAFFFTPLSAFFLQKTKLIGYSSILALALLTMVLATVGRTYDYYYRARHKINFANFMEFLRTQGWMLPLLLLFLLLKNFNLAQVFIIWSSFSLLSLLVYAWRDKNSIFDFLSAGGFKSSLAVPGLKFGLPLAIGSIFSWLLTYADRYLLSLYATTTVVGIYSVATSILGILLTMSVAASNVILPYFTEAWWNDRKKSQTYLNALLKYGFFILIPGIFGAVVLRSELITLLAGPKYLAAAPLLITLSFYPIFAFLQGIFGTFLGLHDKPRLVLYITIIGAAINVGLNVLLIPHFGMNGAAASIVLSNFLMFVMMLHQSKSFSLLNFKFIKLPHILLSSIIMSLLLFKIHPANFIGKILAILFGAASYLGASLALRVFDQTEIKLIRSYLNI